MELLSTATLLLGLVFSIIVILFIVISILLIYSLLMISVETKTFENGVLRLVGLSKANCVHMILVQSIMFVIPSIIFGYGASIPTLGYLYKYLYKNQPAVKLSKLPSVFASIVALVLGLIIPLVSSIIPIRLALAKNLNESLVANRSKSKGVIVTTNDGSTNAGPYLLFGGVAVIAGMSIFYFLPVAVLSFNIGLVLQIFFLILLGLIFGLTLIALNL
jgi:hypothetical protein